MHLRNARGPLAWQACHAQPGWKETLQSRPGCVSQSSPHLARPDHGAGCMIQEELLLLRELSPLQTLLFLPQPTRSTFLASDDTKVSCVIAGPFAVLQICVSLKSRVRQHQLTKADGSASLLMQEVPVPDLSG